MINFIIQVQLHDASRDDVQLFNRKMRMGAFIPINGRLPPPTMSPPSKATFQQ
jgi:hypothetical protein